MKLVPKKNLILFGVCLVIAVACFSNLAIEIRIGGKKIHTTALSDGWTVVAHGVTYNDVVLGKDRFDTFNIGDVFEFSRTLPDENISNPMLATHSVHSMVDVYLDGEHIYNYGQGYYDAGKMLGYGWNYVCLPEDYAGKTVKIVYSITENKAFEGIPSVYLGNADDMLKEHLIDNRVFLAIGLFLIVIGALGMLFALILSFRNFSALKMFCIMLFAFLIGVYTMANSDLMRIFNLDLAQGCQFEYMALYTFAIPFTVYFADWVTDKGFPRQIMLFYNYWVLVEFIFAVTVYILHITNLVHMPHFVTSSHICMLVTIVLIVLLTVTRMRITKKMDKGLAVGFAIALSVAAFELVRYNVAKYMTGFKDNKYNSSIGVAALIIVITLFIDFMSKIAGNLRKEAEAKAFEKMAYNDELTGLLNRRGIEEPMNKLKSSKAMYAIISIDMNLLKMMNDTYGHVTGDRALSLLAKKLKEAFPEPCAVARTGGDEFVVTIPNADKEWVAAHVRLFKEKLDEYNNKKNDNVTLSAAHGVAFSDEAENPEKVLKIADDRMYQDKKESKMGRQ